MISSNKQENTSRNKYKILETWDPTLRRSKGIPRIIMKGFLSVIAVQDPQ